MGIIMGSESANSRDSVLPGALGLARLRDRSGAVWGCLCPRCRLERDGWIRNERERDGDHGVRYPSEGEQ
jgi:hypothetical protein